MSDNLERRRLAIAEALRAAMAEPVVAVSTGPDHGAPTDSDHAVSVMPHQSKPGVVTQMRPRQAAEPAAAPSDELPSIRAALVAEIDWEATDTPAPAGEPALLAAVEEPEPATAETVDRAEHVEADLTVAESAGTETREEPAETAEVDTESDGTNIPPVDTAGSMSPVASLALFGHA